MACQTGITVKPDHKAERFSAKDKALLYQTVGQSRAAVGFTVTSVPGTQGALENCHGCEIHYDGSVTLEVLQALSALLPRERLVVWLPFPMRTRLGLRLPVLHRSFAKRSSNMRISVFG